MKSQFRNRGVRSVRPQPAAANVFVIVQQKDRTVLKVVHLHSVDLALQSNSNFAIGKGPPKKRVT